MKKSNFLKNFNLKNDKEKISILILACLFLVFGYVVINFFGNNKKDVQTSLNDGNQLVDEVKVKEQKDLSKYEEKQKQELKSILKQISGVGNVDVMISFESDETKVPALDTNKQSSTTEEKDKEGGERVTSQENDGSKVVVTNNDSGNEPLILKTYKPKVIGVVIVAEGAENSKIKYDISKAISNLYNLSMDKVNVYEMKN